MCQRPASVNSSRTRFSKVRLQKSRAQPSTSRRGRRKSVRVARRRWRRPNTRFTHGKAESRKQQRPLSRHCSSSVSFAADNFPSLPGKRLARDTQVRSLVTHFCPGIPRARIRCKTLSRFADWRETAQSSAHLSLLHSPLNQINNKFFISNDIAMRSMRFREIRWDQILCVIIIFLFLEKSLTFGENIKDVLSAGWPMTVRASSGTEKREID